MRTPPSDRRPSGFTLVELLVVIGIIALLISVLLPSLSKAREQAKQTTCQSQLRQIGLGLMIYAQANRSWLPTWSGWQVIEGKEDNLPDEKGTGWTEQLARSFVNPDNKIYNCPSFPVDPKINYFLSARYSYATGRQSMKISEMKLASRYIVSGDCTQTSLYPAPYGVSTATPEQDDCDKDDATQRACVWRNEPGGLNIHRNGNNLLFGDGHVAVYPQFNPQEMTFHPKINGVNWPKAQWNNELGYALTSAE